MARGVARAVLAAEAAAVYDASADGVRAELAALAGRVRALPVEGDGLVLREVVTGLEQLRTIVAGVSAQATGALLRRGAVGEDGARTATSWLGDQFGLSKAEAGRRTALADALDALPGTAEALRSGAVAEAQAVEIARTVKRGRLGDAAATEAALLEVAVSSTPEQLRDEVRRREDAADADALARDEALQHRRRRAWWRHDRDRGVVRLGAELDAANGAIALAALEAFVAPDPADTPEEERRSGDQLRADALVDLCQAGLDAGAAGDAGGVRPHVTVVVEGVPDASRPRGWRWAGEGEAVGPLSGTALERFWCDGAVRRAVVDADGMPLDIGRADRRWPAAIRTAIVVRDGRCRWPGCDLPP